MKNSDQDHVICPCNRHVDFKPGQGRVYCPCGRTWVFSLFDQIQGIADEVPADAWRNVPKDLAKTRGRY